MIKVKIAQTMQNILNFIDRKSNLETGRNGSKSGVKNRTVPHEVCMPNSLSKEQFLIG